MTKNSTLNKNLDKIFQLLQSLNLVYEIHSFGEDGEYNYLKEGEVCITINNSNKDNPLYIDFVADEVILSYYKWHNHYAEERVEEDILPDIKSLLTNQKCLIIINSAKRWLSSTISNEPLDSNYEYNKNIEKLPKEFREEITQLGGNVELYYWNPKYSVTIDINPRGEL